MTYLAADIPGIDAATKRRMLAWNTLAFGAKGVGLGEVVGRGYDAFLDDGIEKEGIQDDPIIRKILTDGLTNLGYTAAIEAVTGDDLNGSLSGTLSPFGSVFADVGLLGVPLDEGGRLTNPCLLYTSPSPRDRG